MAKLAWIALLAAGICTGTARVGCADEGPDAPDSEVSTEPRLKTDAPPLPPAYEGVLPDTTYIGDVVLLSAFDGQAISYPANRLDLDFQDNSTLARLKRIKSLSLLTLSDQGSSRLFLGVNEDGLLGLHFAASPGGESEDEPIELARMPYVETDDQD